MSCMHRSTDATVCMCDTIVSKGVKIEQGRFKITWEKFVLKDLHFFEINADLAKVSWLKVLEKVGFTPKQMEEMRGLALRSLFVLNIMLDLVGKHCSLSRNNQGNNLTVHGQITVTVKFE
ncbi:hypothetical protein H5410_057930 [Solanum commersonii]|uniref:Uncharacterized protein n=1 Tax=Solanum commersonii TaxID=4109 RepID=A0A9J5WRM5_SOLCO|nr:hypothetical protein H5410_057930 [Solanum commersonii]